MKKKGLIRAIILGGVIALLVGCDHSVNYTDEASVDAMFPYMRIGLKDFAIAKNVSTDEMKNLPEQKEWMLECFALIRLMANTPEFEEAVMNADFTSNATYKSSDGGASVNKGEKYDNQVILKVVQNRKYDIRIVRSTKSGMGFSASVSPFLYTRSDYGKNENSWQVINVMKEDWTNYSKYPWGKNQMPCLLFHEMIHNSGWGVSSDTAGEIPLVMQDITRALGGRIIGGDLKAKYADAYEGLKTYYKTRYAAQVQAPDVQL